MCEKPRWPIEIELTVFGFPEILRLDLDSLTGDKPREASYRTLDGEKVDVVMNELGHITRRTQP